MEKPIRMEWNMDLDRSIQKNQPILENTYIKLPEVFYTKQFPDRTPLHKTRILNETLAHELGMDVSFFKSKEGEEFLSGYRVLEHTCPIAQAYAGHQFGYFTMLGDGRAILLGEYLTQKGERYDIQLKGSGRTPYSRGGDGKAVLGPMLREYIISEGMHGLGIPTTRSLAVSLTGEPVRREEMLDGAVLTRIAKSHIRVGTFEYASKFLGTDHVKALADYTIKRHFSTLEQGVGGRYCNKYHGLLGRVVERQAYLIAKWQLNGFIHGVMNTDNMLVSGETIDYGPCAFMNQYKPDTVFSSIDVGGRYAYENQPTIAMWNLAVFSETLLPLLDQIPSRAIELAEMEVTAFAGLYQTYWLEGMGKKLGIFAADKEDIGLITELLNLMERYQADYTDTFFQLTQGTFKNTGIFRTPEWKQWFSLWKKRLEVQNQPLERVQRLMKQNNPVIIPRNHLVEEALKMSVEERDDTALKKLADALRHPFDYETIPDEYIEPPKEYDCKYKTYCGT